jgi:hypothetical protein
MTTLRAVSPGAPTLSSSTKLPSVARRRPTWYEPLDVAVGVGRQVHEQVGPVAYAEVLEAQGVLVGADLDY